MERPVISEEIINQLFGDKLNAEAESDDEMTAAVLQTGLSALSPEEKHAMVDVLDAVADHVYRKLPPHSKDKSVLPARGETPAENDANVLAWTREHLLELKFDRAKLLKNIRNIMPSMQSMIVDVRYANLHDLLN